MSKVKAAWLWDMGDPNPRAVLVHSSEQAACTVCPRGHQPPLGDKAESSPRGVFPSPGFSFSGVPGEGVAERQGHQHDTHPGALHSRDGAGHTFQLMPPPLPPSQLELGRPSLCSPWDPASSQAPSTTEPEFPKPAVLWNTAAAQGGGSASQDPTGSGMGSAPGAPDTNCWRPLRCLFTVGRRLEVEKDSGLPKPPSLAPVALTWAAACGR